MMVVAAEQLSLDVWNDRVEFRVHRSDKGDPLVFLHGANGPAWDEFLEVLAEEYQVYAPHLPGTTPESPNPQPNAVREVDNLMDLLICYDEMLSELDFDPPVPLVGHSFGGMLACELASMYPEKYSRLSLIAPAGLWRDEHPIPVIPTLAPEELPARAFYDPESDTAQEFFEMPEDPEDRAETMTTQMWNQACCFQYLWPIPDNGLERRIHRIDQPTQIVWGAQDGLIPPAYADVFADQIENTEVLMVEKASHMVHLEQLSTVSESVVDFLKESI